MLFLERKAGTGWEVRDEHAVGDIPYPKPIGLLVIAECAVGTWRMRYDVTTTSGGKVDRENPASDMLCVGSREDCQP